MWLSIGNSGSVKAQDTDSIVWPLPLPEVTTLFKKKDLPELRSLYSILAHFYSSILFISGQ